MHDSFHQPALFFLRLSLNLMVFFQNQLSILFPLHIQLGKITQGTAFIGLCLPKQSDLAAVSYHVDDAVLKVVQAAGTAAIQNICYTIRQLGLRIHFKVMWYLLCTILNKGHLFAYAIRHAVLCVANYTLRPSIRLFFRFHLRCCFRPRTRGTSNTVNGSLPFQSMLYSVLVHTIASLGNS